ncbi:MAG: lanthionine synthetase LanC family protein, partial [Acidobacteriota bacterium]
MAKRPVSPALLQQVARIAQRALPAPGAPHLDDLYDGDDIGSWLTRALAWRVDADADAADARAAEATRGAIIANLRDAAAQASANRGVGGLVGDGATVYGLSLAAHLLEAPTLLDAAADHARLHLTAQRLHADRHLDLVLGTGGALLALLAWLDANAARPAASPPARSDDRDVVRARAVDAGEALCAAIDTAIDRHPTLRRSGMAHGAAGIAYALARLDAHLDRDPSSDDSTTLRDAVRTLIAHENRLRIDGNRWRDTDDRDDGLEAWCAGTPGIAAARRASARLLTARDPALAAQLDADADIAFTHARRQPYGGVDHLCCG